MVGPARVAPDLPFFDPMGSASPDALPHMTNKRDGSGTTGNCSARHSIFGTLHRSLDR